MIEAGVIAHMDDIRMPAIVFWLSSTGKSTQLAVKRLRFHAWLCHFLGGLGQVI